MEEFSTTVFLYDSTVSIFNYSDGEDIIEPFCQDFKGTYCNFLKTEEIYVTSRSDQDNAERSILGMCSDIYHTGSMRVGGVLRGGLPYIMQCTTRKTTYLLP